jgi:hypothetical protein
MCIDTENGTAIDRGKTPSSHFPRKSVKSSRILMWEFADARRSLRLLHRELPTPEWIALVPHDLVGSDLEEVIIRNAKSANVIRYETAMKDVVYMGGLPPERSTSR